jgi:hypothetical protein
VKDMSSKPKKDISCKSKNDETKRHIVLPRKRKIIGVEDILDKLEDFDHWAGPCAGRVGLVSRPNSAFGHWPGWVG